jgi:hypothetical protein
VLEGAPYGQSVDEAKVNHGFSTMNLEAVSLACWEFGPFPLLAVPSIGGLVQ